MCQNKLANQTLTNSPCAHMSAELLLVTIQQYFSGRYSDWLRAEWPRVRSSSPGRVKNCYFSISSRLAVGHTQLPIQWVPGALSFGVKRPEHEADHTRPASAEIKKMWLYTFTPLYAFMT
jgi:hypothetical protein